MSLATIDRSVLEQGLREALQINESSFQFNYKTLVLGSTASIIKVKSLKYKARNPYSNVVVKMFRNEYLDDQASEPIHDLFNQPDKLYNAEERNLRNIEALLGKTFVPTLYGKSTNHRILVMEPLGSKTRKDRLLTIAKNKNYTGENNDVPSEILDIFYNGIAILGPFNGACHTKADEFERLHNYSDDAQALESKWVGSFEERLLRLHRRCKKGKQLDIDFTEDLKVIDDALKSFSKLEDFYHGDFNLLQILGEKIIDFELFGRNIQGIDLASLLVVAGLKNSAGIILSKQFENLLDQYIVSVHKTKESIVQKYQKTDSKRSTPFQANLNKSLRQAINESRSLDRIPASDLHRQALEISGNEQEYANLIFSNYLQALNKCIRLGAAYDRMDHLKNRLKVSDEPTDYSVIINGLRTGMGSLLDNIDENRERFKLVSPTHEKKELIKGYRYLLNQKLGII